MAALSENNVSLLKLLHLGCGGLTQAELNDGNVLVGKETLD